jgi:hypothetical protein
MRSLGLLFRLNACTHAGLAAVAVISGRPLMAGVFTTTAAICRHIRRKVKQCQP